MKPLFPRLGLLVALLWLAADQGEAANVPAAKLTLRPSYGGAVLDGKIFAPGEQQLTGVWSGAGTSRLLKCAPRCTIVTSIPFKNTLFLTTSSGYRVALGGQFRPGDKVSVTLRFGSQRLLITEALITRP